MIVGVCGLAQHGKDTIGKRLVERWGYERMGFADQLKELALEVNPVIPYDSASWGTLVDLVTQHEWEAAKRLYPEVRRFLQELGTGVRDLVHEDAWVHALEMRWLDAGYQNTVITDVRFGNEVAWIRRHGGVLVRVVRRQNGKAFENGVDPNHASEKFVPFLPAHFIVANDGDIMDLYLKVDAIAADLEEGFSGSSPRTQP